MFLYYAILLPLARRIGRGFYVDGIWADSAFIPYPRNRRDQLAGGRARGHPRRDLAAAQSCTPSQGPGRALRRRAPPAPRQDRRARDPVCRHRARSRRDTTSGTRCDRILTGLGIRDSGFGRNSLGIRGMPGLGCFVKAPGRLTDTLTGRAANPESRIPSPESRRETHYGSTTDLEGLSQGQPGEHPDQGVPGDRVERHAVVQPAPRRVPDAHSAEALVPALQPRGAQLGAGQGLRVREGALRRALARRTSRRSARSRRASSTSCSSPTTSSIDPMYVDRAYYLAPDGPVASDAFAVMREGMAGKVGVGKLALYGREYLVAVRPHRPRHRDAHAAPRGRDPQHGRGRGTELGADEGEARGDQAREAGDRDLRGRRSTWRATRTSTAKGCSGSSTRRSPARTWSRRPSRRRRRS